MYRFQKRSPAKQPNHRHSLSTISQLNLKTLPMYTLLVARYNPDDPDDPDDEYSPLKDYCTVPFFLRHSNDKIVSVCMVKNQPNLVPVYDNENTLPNNPSINNVDDYKLANFLAGENTSFSQETSEYSEHQITYTSPQGTMLPSTIGVVEHDVVHFNADGTLYMLDKRPPYCGKVVRLFEPETFLQEIASFEYKNNRYYLKNHKLGSIMSPNIKTKEFNFNQLVSFITELMDVNQKKHKIKQMDFAAWKKYYAQHYTQHDTIYGAPKSSKSSRSKDEQRRINNARARYRRNMILANTNAKSAPYYKALANEAKAELVTLGAKPRQINQDPVARITAARSRANRYIRLKQKSTVIEDTKRYQKLLEKAEKEEQDWKDILCQLRA